MMQKMRDPQRMEDRKELLSVIYLAMKSKIFFAFPKNTEKLEYVQLVAMARKHLF